MKLLIWGISCVGKTTIGRKLSEKLNCKFYDIDEIIIDRFGSIDLFQEEFPDDDHRFFVKHLMMLDIISDEENDFIMAVSPIFSIECIENILDTNVDSIEIIDNADSIYDRLVLEGDDALEYKTKHKEYYMRQIKWDQLTSYREFRNIPKVDIDNQNIDEAVDTVYKYLVENEIIKG